MQRLFADVALLPDQVCTVKEAKGIYPLLGIAANVALVAAGNFMKLVNARLAVRARISNFINPAWCPPDKAPSLR